MCGQHSLASFQFCGNLLVDLKRISLAGPQSKSCGVVVGDSITENLMASRCQCSLLGRVLLLLLR